MNTPETDPKIKDQAEALRMVHLDCELMGFVIDAWLDLEHHQVYMRNLTSMLDMIYAQKIAITNGLITLNFEGPYGTIDLCQRTKDRRLSSEIAYNSIAKYVDPFTSKTPFDASYIIDQTQNLAKKLFSTDQTKGYVPDIDRIVNSITLGYMCKLNFKQVFSAIENFKDHVQSYQTPSELEAFCRLFIQEMRLLSAKEAIRTNGESKPKLEDCIELQFAIECQPELARENDYKTMATMLTGIKALHEVGILEIAARHVETQDGLELAQAFQQVEQVYADIVALKKTDKQTHTTAIKIFQSGTDQFELTDLSLILQSKDNTILWKKLESHGIKDCAKDFINLLKKSTEIAIVDTKLGELNLSAFLSQQASARKGDRPAIVSIIKNLNLLIEHNLLHQTLDILVQEPELSRIKIDAACDAIAHNKIQLAKALLSPTALIYDERTNIVSELSTEDRAILVHIHPAQEKTNSPSIKDQPTPSQTRIKKLSLRDQVNAHLDDHELSEKFATFFENKNKNAKQELRELLFAGAKAVQRFFELLESCKDPSQISTDLIISKLCQIAKVGATDEMRTVKEILSSDNPKLNFIKKYFEKIKNPEATSFLGEIRSEQFHTQIPQGKFTRLVVFGGDNNQEAVISAVKERAASVEIIFANWSGAKSLDTSLLKKDDLVIMITAHAAHRHSDAVYAACRKSDIAFVPLRFRGDERLIEVAEKVHQQNL